MPLKLLITRDILWNDYAKPHKCEIVHHLSGKGQNEFRSWTTETPLIAATAADF